MATNRKTQPKSKSRNLSSASSSNYSRRRLIKSLAGAGGVAASAKLVPGEWTEPLVGVVYAPAHAQTTCVGTSEGGAEFNEEGNHTFTVPTGVCQLFITAVGATGGGGGGGVGTVAVGLSGEDGFEGASANVVINVTTNQVLSIQVGSDGGPGEGATEAGVGEGGAPGAPDGEGGADGSSAAAGVYGGGGGGSGGSSRVSEGGTEHVLAQGGAGGRGGGVEGNTSIGGAGGAGYAGGAQEGGEGGFGTVQPTNAGDGASESAPGNVEISW